MSSAEYYPFKCTATVHPVEAFNAIEDATVLRKAMKGIGTDEKAIIEVLARRGVVQRLEIAQAFKNTLGRDLFSDLKSECSGRFKDVLVALMTPLPQYYAKELHAAVAGLGTDEEAIIEVVSTLSNYGIKTIAHLYAELYKTTLEKDLKGDTSGHFRKLLVALVQGNRDENKCVDRAAANADARAMFEAGAAKWGTDEEVFNAILVTRSYQQLQAVFQQYEQIAGHDIETAIRKEFSGSIEDGLLAIVQCSKSKVDFFAERLHQSMKGLGTKDSTLIRIIVSRSEIDLGDIKKAFEIKYGKSLGSWIKGDTSGDYQRILLALIGHVEDEE